jgi:hypothetical protein
MLLRHFESRAHRGSVAILATLPILMTGVGGQCPEFP